MLKNHFALMAIMVATVTVSGIHLLTAQEIPGSGARASHRQIKDLLDGHPTLTATTTRSIMSMTRDLRSLADDLDQAGHHEDSVRLKKIVEEIVRHAVSELGAKRERLASLNEEIDELKRIIGQ